MDLEECNQITDLTLAHLTTGCPSLEKLSLTHCALITDDGIRQLAADKCGAESLSVLELDNCPLITDRTLEHLVSWHNLQRMELFDCQMISRAAIRKLKNHLPNIKLHAYFAPFTPPPVTTTHRPRYCRCYEISEIRLSASPENSCAGEGTYIYTYVFTSTRTGRVTRKYPISRTTSKTPNEIKKRQNLNPFQLNIGAEDRDRF
ncbi:F-box/LRR-repeat protein 20-like isoform X2 [Bactrocera dorsalis]|uniref:F-box/LRR-repeat protein 20-like isoform X2 n=1 Tax=Bactrocera dorsalis TaxID=27457 RepID=A0ABM3JL42_BACDO|nr:F-box/LRR-repeat protein 20-like isoform X2 [Bactrocera dorsalis]